jgi:hypothetical protein
VFWLVFFWQTTDDGWRTPSDGKSSHAKWWQKLTLPLARWAKNMKTVNNIPTVYMILVVIISNMSKKKSELYYIKLRKCLSFNNQDWIAQTSAKFNSQLNLKFKFNLMYISCNFKCQLSFNLHLNFLLRFIQPSPDVRIRPVWLWIMILVHWTIWMILFNQ